MQTASAESVRFGYRSFMLAAFCLILIATSLFLGYLDIALLHLGYFGLFGICLLSLAIRECLFFAQSEILIEGDTLRHIDLRGRQTIFDLRDLVSAESDDVDGSVYWALRLRFKDGRKLKVYSFLERFDKFTSILNGYCHVKW